MHLQTSQYRGRDYNIGRAATEAIIPPPTTTKSQSEEEVGEVGVMGDRPSSTLLLAMLLIKYFIITDKCFKYHPD